MLVYLRCTHLFCLGYWVFRAFLRFCSETSSFTFAIKGPRKWKCTLKILRNPAVECLSLSLHWNRLHPLCQSRLRALHPSCLQSLPQNHLHPLSLSESLAPSTTESSACSISELFVPAQSAPDVIPKLRANPARSALVFLYFSSTDTYQCSHGTPSVHTFLSTLKQQCLVVAVIALMSVLLLSLSNVSGYVCILS